MFLDSNINYNLNLLCSLQENNKYQVIDNKLIEDKDNFHDINSPNIEYTIINTLLFSLNIENKNISEKIEILNKIGRASCRERV